MMNPPIGMILPPPVDFIPDPRYVESEYTQFPVHIPEGWEFVEFRTPTENFIQVHNNEAVLGVDQRIYSEPKFYVFGNRGRVIIRRKLTRVLVVEYENPSVPFVDHVKRAPQLSPDFSSVTYRIEHRPSTTQGESQ